MPVAIAALYAAAGAGCGLRERLPGWARIGAARSPWGASTPWREKVAFVDDGDTSSLRTAVRRSLDALNRPERAEGPVYEVGGLRVTAADLRRTLEVFDQGLQAAPEGSDWGEWIRSRFDVVRVSDRPLLVTGYYEPELPASRERTERFRYPIYRLPDDLVDIDVGAFCAACAGRIAVGRVQGRRFVPYYSRADIDGSGALQGREAELAWLDDPVEVFFLHVQGSGLLRFEDGSAMRVSYAGSNGRPYRSIGKILVEAGKMPLEEASLSSLKAYVRAHPEERDSLFAQNERYVFFRPVPVGPIGSLGVPLTAGRSLAVDSDAYPLGSLGFLRVGAESGSDRPASIARFVCAQDTGAAITGPARVDLFWGTGEAAARRAGDLRATGELYILVAR